MTASPRVPRLAGGALAGWEPAHRKRHTRNVYMNTSDVMKLLRPVQHYHDLGSFSCSPPRLERDTPRVKPPARTHTAAPTAAPTATSAAHV